MLFTAPDPASVSGGLGDFPARRTHCLAHPSAGPDLAVTSGFGRVQHWDGPLRQIRPGDVVNHSRRRQTLARRSAGYGDESDAAIQEALDGKSADWMEKVSDEQYA